MDRPSRDSGYAGTEKQCVAFARRWLQSNKGLSYGDVDIASDIWDCVSYYIRVSDSSPIIVSNTLNGARRLPCVGDLIIYSEKFLGTGHVAVVVAVDGGTNKVCVHEQNYANRYHAPYQERYIPFISNHNKYWLLDSYLLGWKSFPKTF